MKVREKGKFVVKKPDKPCLRREFKVSINSPVDRLQPGWEARRLAFYFRGFPPPDRDPRLVMSKASVPPQGRDFPGGSVVERLPANAGDRLKPFMDP